MEMYDVKDDDYMKMFKDSPCPFVRSGECEIPPCNSCFMYQCAFYPGRNQVR